MNKSFSKQATKEMDELFYVRRAATEIIELLDNRGFTTEAPNGALEIREAIERIILQTMYPWKDTKPVASKPLTKDDAFYEFFASEASEKDTLNKMVDEALDWDNIGNQIN